MLSLWVKRLAALAVVTATVVACVTRGPAFLLAMSAGICVFNYVVWVLVAPLLLTAIIDAVQARGLVHTRAYAQGLLEVARAIGRVLAALLPYARHTLDSLALWLDVRAPVRPVRSTDETFTRLMSWSDEDVKRRQDEEMRP